MTDKDDINVLLLRHGGLLSLGLLLHSRLGGGHRRVRSSLVIIRCGSGRSGPGMVFPAVGGRGLDVLLVSILFRAEPNGGLFGGRWRGYKKGTA